MTLRQEGTPMFNCAVLFDRNQLHFQLFYLLGSSSFTDVLSFSHIAQTSLKCSCHPNLAWLNGQQAFTPPYMYGSHHCELSLVRETRRGSGLIDTESSHG